MTEIRMSDNRTKFETEHLVFGRLLYPLLYLFLRIVQKVAYFSKSIKQGRYRAKSAPGTNRLFCEKI